MKELLKLQNVNYEIMDISIFEDVNASVQQGEIIGVIGKKMVLENLPYCKSFIMTLCR